MVTGGTGYKTSNTFFQSGGNAYIKPKHRVASSISKLSKICLPNASVIKLLIRTYNSYL